MTAVVEIMKRFGSAKDGIYISIPNCITNPKSQHIPSSVCQYR